MRSTERHPSTVAKRTGSPARRGSRRHVPQRTCVGCRTVEPKRALTRIVRTPSGIEIDPTGKAPGRGAYLHPMRSCWEAALRGSLGRALKVELSSQEREALRAAMDELPDERVA